MGRIGRLLLAGLALAAWSCAGLADARDAAKATVETPGDFAISALMPAAVFDAQRGDSARVLWVLERAMQDEVFAQLSPARAYQVASLYGAAAYNLGEWELAHRALVRATAQPQATLDDWSYRLHAAIRAGDAADADLSFRHLTAVGEPALATFDGRQLDRLDRQLGSLPYAREARLRLGRELEREDWTPPFVHYDPSRVWLDYALALMDAGQPAKARAALARVTDPTVVMAMQADRRFDAIVAADPAFRDPRAVAERYLAAARTYARDNPRMISGRIAVARALDLLDRPAEALQLMQDTNLALSRGPHSLEPFDDMGEADVAEYWRSANLLGLGRVEEAVAARTAAATCRCSSLDALQLARALLQVGRIEEADQRLDGLSEDGLGPEDRMTLAETRACVAAARGDTARQEAQLSILAAHEALAPEALDQALVCAGDLDRAAAVLSRQLGDPQMRLDALAALQTYAAGPVPTKFETTLRARWAALAAQPLVRVAIDRVGRLKTFDLQRRDFMG